MFGSEMMQQLQSQISPARGQCFPRIGGQYLGGVISEVLDALWLQLRTVVHVCQHQHFGQRFHFQIVAQFVLT